MSKASLLVTPVRQQAFAKSASRWHFGVPTQAVQNMNYRLSDHAKKRLQQRKIKPEWLAATLANPDRIENDPEDATLVHALLDIP
ncbi:MAG: DUF4258 domain-containing protein [Gammaproteobacteria bacterium]|nr:DUF4258 domain-containing protein [Gammaproteobacteria bacterium]MBU1723088.1 DUF4258 domain-containing protein [Gammaproteobacteria bacterium]MBU2004158.1 DUF4258 domain-containing protein [Gammaproteobacteria bacterium]